MFLLRSDPELDESLESYLIRLSELNHFRVRQLFPHFAKLLQKQHGKLAGAMPTELSRFNLYHAKTSSSKRYWALHLLSYLCCKERLPLLELSVLRSDRLFGERHRALFWKGMEIPRVFFRSNRIPVCPQCLHEKSFIPVFWHISLIRSCPRHKCALIFNCPACGSEVDYIRDEKLHQCQCGFVFSDAPMEPTDPKVAGLAAQIYGLNHELVDTDNLLLSSSTAEAVFGAVLFYTQWVDGCNDLQSDEGLLRCINFFENWPSPLFTLLDELAEEGMEYAERSMRETAFRSIFGPLLRICCYLPENRLKTNEVLKAVFTYLDLRIYQENHKFAEISQTLLDSFEACTILGVGTKQLSRVIEEGLLHPRYPQKEKTAIHPDQPLFKLKDVFLLWSVRLQTKYSNRSLYLSRW